MVIAFDLDGTLSDPIKGIAASINHALKSLGYPEKEEAAMAPFIGPPLEETFIQLFKSTDQVLIQSAITCFRQRYARIGFSENILYPGIPDLLDRLDRSGLPLYIATQKKTTIAKSVAKFFKLSHFFKDILGCGPGRTKSDCLNEIKAAEGNSLNIMIGDRLHDMIAGKAAGFTCIGVLWGYGGKDELLQSGADHLCHKPEDIHGIIETLNDTQKKTFPINKAKI